MTPGSTRRTNFNPRLPEGRRREKAMRRYTESGISIHASPKGGDMDNIVKRIEDLFQSTPPRREATGSSGGWGPDRRTFQSTPPRWEATGCDEQGGCG